MMAGKGQLPINGDQRKLRKMLDLDRMWVNGYNINMPHDFS